MGGCGEEGKCVQGRHYKEFAMSFRKWAGFLQEAMKANKEVPHFEERKTSSTSEQQRDMNEPEREGHHDKHSLQAPRFLIFT